MDLLGSSLGRYRLETRLGSGGMGEVFRASVAGEPDVAVKVLLPHLLEVRGAFERFRREAELGRTITHPNVVRTLEADTAAVGDRVVHFLAMEFVEGQTLQQLLEELGHLPEELCSHIGLQVARALSAIHGLGAVHRDLKPANVIITADHEVKVMDFGVAHVVEDATRLSEAGAFLGSVLYAAPEQWDSQQTVDGRADLFTLGIVLYELATGRHPFAGLQGTAPLSALAKGKIEPASATNPELSPFFVELVASLLETDPARRFPAAELLHGVIEAGERSAWWQEHRRELELSGRGRVRRLDVRRDARVCGRDAELEQLGEALAQVREGRGQVVLVEGESGIGKTRLVDEFVRLQGGSVELLFGTYAPGGGATGAGALSTAFREHLGRTRLEQRLTELLPEMPGVVAPFADLLRGTGEGNPTHRMSTDTISSAFLETARALAQATPLVLLLDNLDFAPRESRLIFASLANAIRDEPILLIGAYRPGEVGESLARVHALEHASRLGLQRLGPQDLTALLTDALGSLSLAQHLGWEIARKSDGNPFYVFEILRDLRQRKRLVRDESGSWRTTGLIRRIDTPHSVRDLLRARLKSLADDERDLLDVAACCGPRFDPGVVASAAGVALVPALKQFRRLERDHGIIRPDGRAYVFDHHQMQEAIYADLFEQLREQYHLAIGTASEARWSKPTGAQAVELTRHFMQGGEPGRARPHLLPALYELFAGYLFHRLEELAKQALAADIDLAPRERFAVLSLLSEVADTTGDPETQAASAAEMRRIADELEDDALRLGALMRTALHCYTASACDEGVKLYEEALALARQLGNRRGEEEAERGIGICWSRLGNREKALPHHLRSLALCEELGLDGSAAAAHTNIAIQLVGAGELDDAEVHYQRAIELARATGNTRWEANATANYGRIFYQRGDYAQAWEHGLRYRELTRRIGDRRGEATSGVILSVLWMLFGAIDEMEHEVARVSIAVEETGDRWLSAYVLQKQSWLAEQRGDLDEAFRLMEESVAVRRAVGDRDGLAVVLCSSGALAAERGDRAHALERLQEALAVEEAEPGTHAQALSELAVLLPERAEEAARALEAAGADGDDTVRAWWSLWRATSDLRHLERAQRGLDALLAGVPPEYQESARSRVRVNRLVCEAWRRETSKSSGDAGLATLSETE